MFLEHLQILSVSLEKYLECNLKFLQKKPLIFVFFPFFLKTSSEVVREIKKKGEESPEKTRFFFFTRDKLVFLRILSNYHSKRSFPFHLNVFDLISTNVYYIHIYYIWTTVVIAIPFRGNFFTFFKVNILSFLFLLGAYEFIYCSRWRQVFFLDLQIKKCWFFYTKGFWRRDNHLL